MGWRKSICRRRFLFCPYLLVTPRMSPENKILYHQQTKYWTFEKENLITIKALKFSALTISCVAVLKAWELFQNPNMPFPVLLNWYENASVVSWIQQASQSSPGRKYLGYILCCYLINSPIFYSLVIFWWKKYYCCMHFSYSRFWSRPQMYTAILRHTSVLLLLALFPKSSPSLSHLSCLVIRIEPAPNHKATQRIFRFCT